MHGAAPFPRLSWRSSTPLGRAFQNAAFSRCHRVPGYYGHTVSYRSLVPGAGPRSLSVPGRDYNKQCSILDVPLALVRSHATCRSHRA